MQLEEGFYGREMGKRRWRFDEGWAGRLGGRRHIGGLEGEERAQEGLSKRESLYSLGDLPHLQEPPLFAEGEGEASDGNINNAAQWPIVARRKKREERRKKKRRTAEACWTSVVLRQHKAPSCTEYGVLLRTYVTVLSM